MDSITQATLGAAVGYAIGGPVLGRKAALWGIGLGTLPDLDVLIRFEDPVANFTYHRSFTHSVLVLAAITPVLAAGIRRFHKLSKDASLTITLMVLLTLVTHPLLDAFTSYGTQLLWPLTDYPFYLASISIIDPIYTLPMLGAVIMALIRPRSPRSRAAVLGAIALSTAYLGWTQVLQARMTTYAEQQLAQNDIRPDRLFVTPTLFNSLLWYVVAVEGDTIHYGFSSLLDRQDKPLNLIATPRNEALLEDLQGSWTVDRLKWFSHGFYQAEVEDKQVVMSDLRMGLAPHFSFRFAVAPEDTKDGPLPISQRVRKPRPEGAVGWIFDRMTAKISCASWKNC
ncbi:metal-dependent hydrolase [Coralliovum pocilloporae]|uniref:metal-dependent hydrolase n=1 Tax=Coralliovum pocilloporae TaxID=3066369 RepID=UPI003306F72D